MRLDSAGAALCLQLLWTEGAILVLRATLGLLPWEASQVPPLVRVRRAPGQLSAGGDTFFSWHFLNLHIKGCVSALLGSSPVSLS